MTAGFRLNGADVSLDGVDPNETLLAFVRRTGLTGTKEGCAEGECGACAVVLVDDAGGGRARYRPVNSCLVLAAACAGREVVTVEGLADGQRLHPVQQAMVDEGGSQCGYCTPGFVMSLFAEHYRDGRATTGFDPESIAGNLCRCTGYRPIRDAGRKMPLPLAGDPFAVRLVSPAPTVVATTIEHAGRRLDRPTTLPALFAILGRSPSAKLVAGGTDVLVEVNQRHARFEHLVAIDGIDALAAIEVRDDAFVIGGAATLSDVEHRLGRDVPMLGALLPLFSSILIKNRATFGGNLATASPIGDGAPALLALGAEVVLLGAAGERRVPLDGFFTGYRTTRLGPGEIIGAVRIPRPLPAIQRFYKVSKRVHDDISTVAVGFGLDLDADGRVARARFGWGGVAATPSRSHDAESAAIGQPWGPATADRVKQALAATFAPIDDHRGSARYRRAMILSLVDKLAAETAP